jgi:hypothetical protein
MRYLRRIGVVGALALAASAPAGAAVQIHGDSLFQLEVTDSLGLPLPNAKLELFTLMEGAIWREWVTIQPYHLQPGMHLLRFSHEGFRASTFSVPLEKGRRVSVRVRLSPESDRQAPRDVVEAAQVRAVGLVLASGAPRDFLGDRRIIDHAMIERIERTRLSEILRRTSRSGVMVLPLSGNRSSVRVGGRGLCATGVMVNGNPTLRTTFARFEDSHWASEPEVIEIVARANAVPFSFRRVDGGDCAMLLVWLRGR